MATEPTTLRDRATDVGPTVEWPTREETVEAVRTGLLYGLASLGATVPYWVARMRGATARSCMDPLYGAETFADGLATGLCGLLWQLDVVFNGVVLAIIVLLSWLVGRQFYREVRA